MTNRRVKIIQSIYEAFATPHDLQVIDRMYREGAKGPAIRKMAYAIRSEFFRMKKELEKHKGKTREIETFDIPRIALEA